MIEVKSLRVGNVFIRNIPTTRGTEYEHGFVLTEKWMGKLFSEDSSFALQDLFPIPLTPEVLDKVGFKKNGSYWVKGLWQLPIYPKKDGGEIIMVPNNNYAAIPLESLHQLQNLFWGLSGEELTVNL